MDTKRNRPTQSLFAISTLALSAAVAVAACGGAGAATSGPGGPDGPASQAPGGGTTTQAPGGNGGETIDVCALLTEADFKEVANATIESAEAGPQFGVFKNGCTWDLVAEGAFVPPEVSLGVVSPGGKSYYETYFEPFNDEYGYEPIENLGDVAVDAEAGSVLVVAGDAFFNLQYVGLTQDDTAIAAELGRKVVANLAK